MQWELSGIKHHSLPSRCGGLSLCAMLRLNSGVSTICDSVFVVGQVWLTPFSVKLQPQSLLTRWGIIQNSETSCTVNCDCFDGVLYPHVLWVTYSGCLPINGKSDWSSAGPKPLCCSIFYNFSILKKSVSTQISFINYKYIFKNPFKSRETPRARV